jgi:PKD repeat protein
MEFTPKELRESAPQNSIGADSGDFNGDGHADFVTVSYTWGQTYINLGNGDGTFTSVVDYLNQYSYGYTSVAAGDFNNDGYDDIAVSHSTSNVDIYRYYNDYGVFGYRRRVTNPNFYTSPVDTYDLNGDDNQDLIIGGYYDGTSLSGIAVMTGNGNESFNGPVAYSGASHELGMITCISAPTLYPAEGVTNIDPVAAIFCDPAEAVAGQTVVVDGKDSSDEDGEIVSYEWDFGDGTMGEGLEVEHVYYDVGEYTITLTVTDDLGATATDRFTVQVSPVTARMRVLPRRLNLKSRGRTMYAWVKLPQGCDATQVDVNAIEVIEDGVPKLVDLENSKRKLKVRTNRWLAKRNKFYVKFDRQATIDAISGTTKRPIIRISGDAYCNGEFVEYSAEDKIRIKKPCKKKKKRWWWNWKKRR